MALKAIFSAMLLIALSHSGAMGAEDPRRDATVTAVEKVMPTVVNIATKTVVERPVWIRDWFGRNFLGYRTMPPQYSAGSGVIVDEEGYVLSNVHVVEGATEIWVKLHNGALHQAEIVASARNTDVAVLKLKAKAGERFQAAQLAAEDDLLLGETVIAMGNPFGLGGSVSRGILSSKSRREAGGDGEMAIEDWLQTDAAINPGNSGGPLINLRGEVIGLNVAVYREGQGIGFAIPNKRIFEALSELFTPEAIRSLWFGARFESKEGAFAVTIVERDSPAAKAGLKPGDKVVRVNNQAPRSLIELHRYLLPRGSSRDISLTLKRGASEQQTRVRLIPQSEYFTDRYLRERLGVTVQPLTPEIARRYRLAVADGLVITEMDRGSPAFEAGLQAGYLITSIEDAPVKDVVSAGKLLHQRGPGEIANIVATSLRSGRSGLFEVVLR